MKRILIIQFLFLIVSSAKAQNEFAASAFYTAFKEVYEDAQAAFINIRGDQRNTGIRELAAEYKVKWMLPLADSGKLVIPVSGKAYAIYYFEPDKLRLKVDQRGANLRDAIINSMDKPLSIRSETTLVNNQPFTVTDYFLSENTEAPVLFRQVIYHNAGKFYLSLEIRSK